MNKIRILFIFLVLIIFIISLGVFSRIHTSFKPKLDQISEFQVTRISGSGAIYSDSQLIKSGNLSRSKAVDISEMNHADEMFVKADTQTSYEFSCFGTFFTVLPDSQIHYQPKTKELCFYNGEYFWTREIKKENFRTLLAVEEKTGSVIPQMILSLPDSGRLKIKDNKIEIWNYEGNLKLNYEQQEYGIKPNQLLQIKNQKVEIFETLPAPEFISPEDKVITLAKSNDSFIKLSWRAVIGTTEYILRIYSSVLKENLMEEIKISDTGKTINLLTYGVNEVFWQVFPYDVKNEREGAPSRMGNIKLAGSISREESEVEPPKLVITSLTTSGNMVLIKGEAEKECQLFINDKPVPINMDGTFYETLTYKQIGPKTINFRLVSPTEMETNITRTVTIFDE